ncbi:MAG: hypothetical protein U0075_11080 [Thermomicrobiales bacterium]
MIRLVALITLIALVAHAHQRGDPWLIAIIRSVRRFLLGVLTFYGAVLVLAMGLGLMNATLRPVAGTLLALAPEGQPPASRAGGMPATLPTRMPATTAPSTPPTPTPRVMMLAFQAPRSHEANTPAPYTQALTPLPTSTPRPAPPAPTPTATPENQRTGCDPAYPDTRTCIPPGPPWDQGCSITDERRFTVLPPDPQRLDHDKDGIGCEPVT